MSRRPTTLSLLASACAALACAALAADAGPAASPAAVPASAPATAAQGKPMRIFSANMCNDLIVLQLVPKERIASITFLAHEAVETLIPGADAGVAINHGLAEEVVMQRPDLILASPWSTAVMRRLAAKVGANVVEIDAATNFEDIRKIVRQIGAAVGEPARAEALVAKMDRDLAELERTRPALPIHVAAWSSGNAVPGAGTLTDEIIRRAGAINLASTLPDDSYSTFGLEELLAARPDAIMRGENRYDGPALRDSVTEHPVVRKAFRDRRLTYPASLYTCGLPQSSDAVRQLREALTAIPPGGVPW